jgi:hypothetical protein
LASIVTSTVSAAVPVTVKSPESASLKQVTTAHD